MAISSTSPALDWPLSAAGTGQPTFLGSNALPDRTPALQLAKDIATLQAAVTAGTVGTVAGAAAIRAKQDSLVDVLMGPAKGEGGMPSDGVSTSGWGGSSGYSAARLPAANIYSTLNVANYTSADLLGRIANTVSRLAAADGAPYSETFAGSKYSDLATKLDELYQQAVRDARGNGYVSSALVLASMS